MVLWFLFLIHCYRAASFHIGETATTIGTVIDDDGSPAVKHEVEGDPLRQTNTIPFGKLCDRTLPEACQHYPKVSCVTNSIRISICRCNYLRTWVPDEENCALNVFSPCSKGIPGFPDSECGKNADCINDTLRLNSVKFCRCRKGFMPVLNEDKIPSICVPDPNFEELDFPLDYETDQASIPDLPLLNLTFLTAAILVCLDYII